MSRDTNFEARNRQVMKVLAIEMALNLFVSAAKGAYGLWSGSLVIATDAIHSLTDAAANVMGLIVTRFSAAPPDAKHPYGHHKLEIVAAACIGLAIGSAAIKFGWSAIESLASGDRAPVASALGFVVLGTTFVVNLFVAWWEAKKAKELQSAFLAADAAHTASDLAVTAAVIATYGASYAGVQWADAVGALLVIAVIGRVAWEVLGSNLSVLVDSAVLEGDHIQGIALAVNGVRGCHRVRSRGSKGAVWIDMHIQVDGILPLREAHHIAHEVEDALRATIEGVTDVTVHMEPHDDTEEPL